MTEKYWNSKCRIKTSPTFAPDFLFSHGYSRVFTECVSVCVCNLNWLGFSEFLFRQQHLRLPQEE